MFAKQDLDERGEIPAPHSLEKHNFNPHNLMGDFDYSEVEGGSGKKKASGTGPRYEPQLY